MPDDNMNAGELFDQLAAEYLLSFQSALDFTSPSELPIVQNERQAVAEEGLRALLNDNVESGLAFLAEERPNRFSRGSDTRLNAILLEPHSIEYGPDSTLFDKRGKIQIFGDKYDRDISTEAATALWTLVTESDAWGKISKEQQAAILTHDNGRVMKTAAACEPMLFSIVGQTYKNSLDKEQLAELITAYDSSLPAAYNPSLPLISTNTRGLSNKPLAVKTVLSFCKNNLPEEKYGELLQQGQGNQTLLYKAAASTKQYAKEVDGKKVLDITSEGKELLTMLMADIQKYCGPEELARQLEAKNNSETMLQSDRIPKPAQEFIGVAKHNPAATLKEIKEAAISRSAQKTLLP